mmetsp:Transcript_192/g.485  ORF Transcript_192/g.485 Transcript_192/m.485 type:complete len:86 (-) Transcript_192:1315-1572(-)
MPSFRLQLKQQRQPKPHFFLLSDLKQQQRSVPTPALLQRDSSPMVQAPARPERPPNIFVCAIVTVRPELDIHMDTVLNHFFGQYC